MRIATLLAFACAALATMQPAAAARNASELREGFAQPPDWARPRVFWWWLQTTLEKSALTRDLEEMRNKGIRGALLWDHGSGPEVYGNKVADLPAGPLIMTQEWRETVRHAIREAGRLGIEISMNMGTGANCGGPWIPIEHSAKALVWSEATLKGPQKYSGALPSPAQGKRWVSAPGMERYGRRYFSRTPAFFRDIAVVAGSDNRWIDITKQLDENGQLEWQVPPGEWTVLRFAYIPTPHKLTSGSPGPGANRDQGYFTDHFSAEATDYHVKHFVEPLVRDAGEYAGKSLKYFHCDSWEIDSATWTPRLLEEFRRRRGYDPVPYLPALAGKITGTKDISERFVHDVRRTLADCLNDYHFTRLLDACHRLGVGFHSEGGGPHPHPVDTLATLSRNDFPMGEFWIKAATHRTTEDTRLFIKPAASAAHVYGLKHVAMEAFTSEGPHWEEDPRELKPIGDRAFVEGANRMILHTFTHSPADAGKPGAEYIAGTHFNPNITWWGQAQAWTDYLARCQYMLTQGLFVGDVLYFNGDQIPNFVGRKQVNPSLGFGYDYDVANAEAILTRVGVKDGRLSLPDGMSYRLLVLPDKDEISLEVLRKVAQLVKDGATVVGRKPLKSVGLHQHVENDRAVRALADELWSGCDGQTVKERRHGKGRIVCGGTLRETLVAAGVRPDFAYTGGDSGSHIDFIHRQTKDADIYFISNQNERPEEIAATFRVSGRRAELWDAATGERAEQVVFESGSGATTLPLRLAPYGSIFVVFQGSDRATHVTAAVPHVDFRRSNGELQYIAWKAGRYDIRLDRGAARIDVAAVPEPVAVEGPWSVRFAKGWGAPESAAFPSLISWTASADEGIRYFSGTARYRTEFTLEPGLLAGNRHLVLDLGRVRNIAGVKLNGRDLGILWKDPWSVEISAAARPGTNVLEVSVTNLWPNRLIGDASLAPEKRFTKSNIMRFHKDWPLLESGLIGPVRVKVAVVGPVKGS